MLRGSCFGRPLFAWYEKFLRKFLGAMYIQEATPVPPWAPLCIFAQVYPASQYFFANLHRTYHMGNNTYVTLVMCNPLELLTHTHACTSLLPINLAMQFMHTCYANLAIVFPGRPCQSEYIESDKPRRHKVKT